MPLQVEKNQFEDLKNYLESEGFIFEERPYQIFLARKNGIVINLYENGKIVLSGGNEEGKKQIEELESDNKLDRSE